MKTSSLLFFLTLSCNLFGQQALLRSLGAGDVLLPTHSIGLADTTFVCGAVSVGANPDAAWVAKVVNGNPEWSYVFELSTRFDAMTRLSNGDLALVGSSFNAGNSHVFVVRMSSQGDTLWARKFASSANESARFVFEQHGDIFVAGNKGPNSSVKKLLLRVSPSGVLLEQLEQGYPSGIHNADEAVTYGDSIAIFGVSRFGSFSTREVSVRVISQGGIETLSRMYGTPAVAEGRPRVSYDGSRYWVATENGGGIGIICLNSSLDKVDSLCVRLVSGSGSLSFPEIFAYGGNLYIGGQVVIAGSSYAFVAKIQVETLNVSFVSVLNSSGFVASKPTVSGNKLIVVSNSGSDVSISNLDTLSGEPFGFIWCEQNLPTIDLQIATYNVVQTELTHIDWLNPALIDSAGSVLSQFPVEVEQCDPMVMPIELVSFEAKSVAAGEVHLFWQTATEFENDYFTIERSMDGSLFEQVVRVSGGGDSQSIRDYQAVDDNAPSGLVYYRLLQTDLGGETHILPTVSVLVSSKGAMVYPNPVSSGGTIHGIFGTCKVFDLQGNHLMTELVAGGQLYIPFPSGIYLIHLDGGEVVRLEVMN